MKTSGGDKEILAILGPTASGKTQLAVALARELNGAIISADSRQVFKGMDIGTGKDLDSYREVPYYLIDIASPGEPYHVAAYRDDFMKAYENVKAKGLFPILCGGSGLYLQAALQGLPYAHVPVDLQLRRSLEDLSDDELRRVFQQKPSAYTPLADTGTRKRLIRAIEIAEYLRQSDFHPDSGGAKAGSSLIIGIRLPVEVRRARITQRLHQRLKAGLVEEVQRLLSEGVSPQTLIHYGLEYKFISYYLQGRISEEELRTRLNTAIHRFAKRQMTFFRKLEKDGLVIHWIDGTLPLEEQLAAVFKTL